MSGFDIRKIADFFPRKKKPVTGMAYCERSFLTETSPRHIRKLTVSGLFPNGGANTVALCTARVDKDTSEVESLFMLEKDQSLSNTSSRICQRCLHEARQILDTE